MPIRVSIVYSPGARQVFEEMLDLQDGATVRQAVQASSLLTAFPELDLRHATVGVWEKGLCEPGLAGTGRTRNLPAFASRS